MGIPWLRILDAVIGVTDLARSRRIRSLSQTDAIQETGLAQAGGGTLESRLAGVVVAALKEAFDRDTRRLEHEREQLEAERLRAERALRLEFMRQAADREIGRFRLLAGAAIAGWMFAAVLSSRLVAAGTLPRVLMGTGWLLLLAAVAASFSAQSRIVRALEHALEMRSPGSQAGSAGAIGHFALWLFLVGLALAGSALLAL